MDVSSWLCSRRISNCFCVCCDQSSIIRDGSFVPATSRARSNSAIVFVFAISMTLRLKSRTPSADAKNASCPACAVCSVAACPLFQLSRAALAALSAIFLPCSTWLMGMSFRPRWPRCVRGDLVPNATLVPFVPEEYALSLYAQPARSELGRVVSKRATPNSAAASQVSIVVALLGNTEPFEDQEVAKTAEIVQQSLRETVDKVTAAIFKLAEAEISAERPAAA